MAASTEVITTPTAGASLTTIWKPPPGVTPGSAGDAFAPFRLTTEMQCSGVRPLAKFCRIGSGGLAADATARTTAAGVTDGSGTTGNTWRNETGKALIEGDYVFLTAGISTLPTGA